jgi:hypothetical protein
MRTLLLLLAALAVATPAAAAVDCTLKDDVTAAQGRVGPCGFVAADRSFRGSPAEQAGCLTRHVARRGTIEGPTLPPYLRGLVGTDAAIGRARLEAYVASLGIDPVAKLGGRIADPVPARYFVIHDTSMPNCSEEDWSIAICPVRGVMPAERDSAAWAERAGFFGHPKPAPKRLGHAWTNRVGDSIVEAMFDLPLVSTKFESCSDAAATPGLFLAVENIQPRIGVPAIPARGAKADDRIAPVPGFTAAQYDRLALLYVTASVRAHRWMIPAFHAVIDSFYGDGHDDPQNFDMDAFSAAVKRHIEALAS